MWSYLLMLSSYKKISLKKYSLQTLKDFIVQRLNNINSTNIFNDIGDILHYDIGDILHYWTRNNHISFLTFFDWFKGLKGCDIWCIFLLGKKDINFQRYSWSQGDYIFTLLKKTSWHKKSRWLLFKHSLGCHDLVLLLIKLPWQQMIHINNIIVKA